MLDAKLIEKNREWLEAEKGRLQKLLSRVASQDSPGSEFRPNYPDIGSKDDENASEVTAYETNIAEEHDLVEKLQRVESALERLGVGTYGLCLKGGEELSAKRLTAVPEAENCVEHEER